MNNSRQRFLDLLADLANFLELNDLRLNANDGTQIILDGTVPINLYWRDEVQQFITFAVVGYADHQLENREELLLDILHAQFFWKELRGFTLAMEPETDLLVLMDKRQPSFFDSSDDLLTYLENFSEVVQQWREKLSGHAGELHIESPDQWEGHQTPDRFAALLGTWLQA